MQYYRQLVLLLPNQSKQGYCQQNLNIGINTIIKMKKGVTNYRSIFLVSSISNIYGGKSS